MKYDVFISHASEDKETVVRPLARLLKDHGVRVWVDEQQLSIGDSLRQAIEKGLKDSRFGLVILSPAFFRKEWPKRELDALLSRDIGEGKVVLPIWHNISAREILEKSPLLADKIALSTSAGLISIVEELVMVLKTTHKKKNEIIVKPKRGRQTNDVAWLPEKRIEKVTFRLQTYTYKFHITSHVYDMEIMDVAARTDDFQKSLVRDALCKLSALYSNPEIVSPIVLEVVIDVPDLSVDISDNHRMLNIETYPFDAVPLLAPEGYRWIHATPFGHSFVTRRQDTWVITRIDEMTQYDINQMGAESWEKLKNDRRKDIEKIFQLYFVTEKGSKFERNPEQNLFITFTLEGKKFNPVSQSWSIPTVWCESR